MKTFVLQCTHDESEATLLIEEPFLIPLPTWKCKEGISVWGDPAKGSVLKAGDGILSLNIGEGTVCHGSTSSKKLKWVQREQVRKRRKLKAPSPLAHSIGNAFASNEASLSLSYLGLLNLRLDCGPKKKSRSSENCGIF